ncbi:uncharacterized protein LAESUDRAFT_656391 [Laetiporus sulphureus 93-53]|uniref:Aspartic peptidase DDI1-type domain-containing protein n=1 Tax=Laetiporus sulphureus 93-53 TaxID=1314785 RepID=A0A165DP70_9APHY|nr:uncharacterized protein LAESUDRAFT_656391 [Laetiporus sulphureus 93-53]KZT05320.1 hypothetical protein LAESUDRAFT_656391 [Laetiporus sulphureus 93-53]
MLLTKGSLLLWVMELIIEDTLQCECILDQGTQICVMHQDIWQDLRALLNPDKAIQLKTTNTVVTKTIRKLPCMHLHFGMVIITVQVQVVQHAPFKILLRQPFFATSACETHNFASREQQITITNLHSGECIMVPTKAQATQCEADLAQLDFQESMNRA